MTGIEKTILLIRNTIKAFFIILLLTSYNAHSDISVSICSWNLLDFGKSKSQQQIEFVAKTVKDFDIVLIQEVVAKDPGGVQAVGRLGDALNRLGAKWEYRISDATSGENSFKRERYAFLWKPSRVKLLGRPWLEIQYSTQIDREPFLATFQSGVKEFTLVNFHAITKTKQPETEVKYFKYLPSEYPNLNLIFCGDFNLPQNHTVFNPLKSMGYKPVLNNQKTSLRKKCISNDCLESELDNIFYNPKKVNYISGGVLHFYRSFEIIDQARGLSDHVPFYFKFSIN
jgi:endonuclease/exonuclease/phosphatase family metal-dependent hydrolase